jgi:hypothetical protein
LRTTWSITQPDLSLNKSFHDFCEFLDVYNLSQPEQEIEILRL